MNKVLLRVAITLTLFTSLWIGFSKNIEIDWKTVSINVTVSNLLDLVKIRLEPQTYGKPCSLLVPDTSDVVYVTTTKGYLLRSILNNNTLVVLGYKAIGNVVPVSIKEDNFNVYILLENGTYLVLNKALNLVKEKEIGLGTVKYLGEAWGKELFITSKGYILEMVPHLRIIGKLNSEEVPLFLSPNKFVKFKLSKIKLITNVDTNNLTTIVKNNVTIIISRDHRENTLTKIFFISYNKRFRGPYLKEYLILRNSTVVGSEDNIAIAYKENNVLYVKFLMRNLTLTVFNFNRTNITNVANLGLKRDVYGFKAHVLVLNNKLLSIRPKDNSILLNVEGVNSCRAFRRNIYCISSNSIYRLGDVADSHTVIKVLLTPDFLNLVRRPKIVANLNPLYDLKSGWKIEFERTQTSKLIEVPSGAYLLSIDTQIGRVIELVPATPVSWDFDPPLIEIDITPEIIVPYVYSLELKIIDSQSKKPIQGAEVIITGVTIRGKRIEVGPLFSDINGTVKINLEKGTYTLRISHLYYKPYIKRISLTKDMKLVIPLTVKGIKLAFQVLSKGAPPFIKKGPIANASIVISGPMQLNLKTDSNGQAQCILRPGNYVITVKAKLHKPLTTSLTVSHTMALKHKVIKYTLSPILYNVTLTVLDALLKKPVLPSLVVFKALSIEGSPSLVIQNTPSNIITAKVPPGEYLITVQAKNYLTYKKLVNIRNDTTLNVYLKLKTIKVKIYVYDELKRLVNVFNITLINKYYNIRYNFTLTSKSNTIEVPPGLYEVKISAPGFEPLVTEISISENTKVLEFTIAHKTYKVIIKALTKDKLLYDYIAFCEGSVQGGPLLKPIKLKRFSKPNLTTTISLPKGTYQVSLTCKSVDGKTAATGITTFTVPIQLEVPVPLKPSKVNVSVRVYDVRNNKPIARAIVKFYFNNKLIGEGMSNNNGIAIISVNSYYLGKEVVLKVEAPGYSAYTSKVILTPSLPIVYLKPAPTIVEILLGNPILIVVIAFIAGAGAYIISTFLGRGEEEEEFEELL